VTKALLEVPSRRRPSVPALRPAAALPVLRILPPLILLGLGIVAWQVIVVAQHVPDFILPSPSAIAGTTVEERGLLLSNSVPTLEVAGFGFLISLAGGFLVALLVHFSRVMELALFPVLIASQAVPLLALAPVLVILMGFSIWPKLVVVGLVCFFPVVVNLVDGLRAVDRDLVNLMRTMGANRRQLLWQVELPSALPYLFSGAKIAATYSVVGALYAEWANSSEGLALIISQAQSRFDTEILFSAMLILTLIGVSFFAIVSVIERLLIPWHKPDPTQQRSRHAAARWER